MNVSSAAGDPTTDPPRLEVRTANLRFGRTDALIDVSLALAPGEIVAILGESGCGKSSLLRLVAGLEVPRAGEVLIDGRRVASPGTAVPPEARGVGMMFQDHALFPHLSVLDNVRFGLNRRPRAEARAMALTRLAEVGLARRVDGYPDTLSGGEAQRVALARALAPEPKLLLLDEPFSSLDPRTRERVRADTLALLRANGTTTILVTHDPAEALEFADRIVLMRAGRIVQTGTGEELYRRPASPFAARALGTVIEIEGRVRDGRVQTPLGSLPAPDTLPPGRATICLRPESLWIVPEGQGVLAQVLRRRFAGAVEHLQLSVDGIASPIALARRPGDPVAADQVLSLALDPAHTFVFAAD